MALSDDVNALPASITDGHTGHLGNHQTIHAALKDHQTRIGALDTRVPDGLAVTRNTSVGERIYIGGTLVHADTGERDITSLLDPAPNSGTLLIRRTRDFVTLVFGNLSYNAGVTANLKIPAQWWCWRTTALPVHNATGGVVADLRGTWAGDLTLVWKTGQAGVSVVPIPIKEGLSWPSEFIGTE